MIRRKYVVYILILFLFMLSGCDAAYWYKDINIQDYDASKIEQITGYDLPQDLQIIAIREHYNYSTISGYYLYVRIHEKDISDFAKNFPESSESKDMTIPMVSFIDWCGLKRDDMNIEAVYSERYPSSKSLCINTGDFIIILKPVNGYNNVYIIRYIGDERPAGKWGVDW